MHCVYIFLSVAFPDQTHVASTSDLRKRLAERNSGKLIHTNRFGPWDLRAYIALPKIHLAEESKRYLRSGSGRAFAKGHLLMQNAPKP
jgi:putative endonuclease